ncbi:MAG: hydroxymethylglutaryl-CoA synthase [Acidimicrobiales bacterium]
MDSILASYEQRTAPWLTLNRDIGNIYTGSLYLALLDLLRQGTLDEGTAISLFSYGSGCTASMRIGALMPGYTAWRAALDPSAELAARIELSVDEYEEIMVEGELVPGPDDALHPENWDLDIDRFMYLGNKDYSRQYAGIS